jgi:hypothetical protein
MLQNRSVRKRTWKVRDIDNKKEEKAITSMELQFSSHISGPVRLCVTYTTRKMQILSKH